MRRRTRMLAVVTAGLLLSVLVWFNYSAVLPLVVEDWGLSGTRAGIVFGAFQAGYLVAIVPAGIVVDRYTPRPVIAAGAVGTGLASLGFAALATGFWSGTALRFLGGVAMAGVYVPGMRFVSDWYPAADRGRAMGVYVGSFAFSSGLSFLVASNVGSALGWRAAVAVTSLGALVAGPLVFALARDPPGDDSTARTGGFDVSLLRNRAYLLAVSVYSWHNWELLGVRNWLLAFLVTVPAVAGTGLAGTVVGVVMAVGGLGNLVGGWLSDRLGRPPAIAVALLASTAISASIALLQGLSLPALVAVLLLYGVALTADSAPTSTTVTEVVPDHRVGTALSVQSLVGFSATVVSPVVFGVALDHAGYALAFGTLAVGGFAGLLSSLALGRVVRTRG